MVRPCDEYIASFVDSFGSVSFTIKHIASHRFRLVFIFGHYYTRASVDEDDYSKLRMLCLARKATKLLQYVTYCRPKIYRVVTKRFFCF